MRIICPFFFYMKPKQYKGESIDLESVKRIYNSDDKEYTSIGCKTKVIFTCECCGEETKRQFGTFRSANFQALCRRCLYHKNNMLKYGVDSPNKLDEVKAKAKETNLKKFGCEYYTQTDEYKKRVIQYNLSHYGVEYYTQSEDYLTKARLTFYKNWGCSNPMKSDIVKSRLIHNNMMRIGVPNVFCLDEVKDKIKMTNLAKYQTVNPMQCDEIKHRMMETNMKRYGCEFAFQNEDIRKKALQTFLDNYGVTNPSMVWDIKKKKADTFMRHYGVDNYSQCIEAHKHRKTLIFYGGEYFDSKPELDYYKACLCANKIIIRHPIKLEYEYDSKICYYFPDFKVDGELVEIKGKHFLNPKTGKWWNPFDHSQDKKFEAKFDCAIRNGVKIIYV